MPWYSSLSDALAANGARHATGSQLAGVRPADRWAGAVVVDDGDEEVREQMEFLRSQRYRSARQELERWHKLTLKNEAGEVVGEVHDGTELRHALRSRPDVSPWIEVGPDTGLLGYALLDVASLVDFAKGPRANHPPDEPPPVRQARSPLEARAMAVEIVPEPPRIRSRLIDPGRSQSMAEIGKEFLAPSPRRLMTWYGWVWPEGWKFRQGSPGVGLKLASHVPADGSVISYQGSRYVVTWSFSALGRELLPVPDWLLHRLGKPA